MLDKEINIYYKYYKTEDMKTIIRSLKAKKKKNSSILAVKYTFFYECNGK